MRSLNALLLATSMMLTGCALHPASSRTPLAQCSLGRSGWKLATHVDQRAEETARLYGTPGRGDRVVWLVNARGDYRYCVLHAGSNGRCGEGVRVLPLWKQDGRWSTTGWLDSSACRSGGLIELAPPNS